MSVATTPIRNDPSTFTISVPHGNVSPNEARHEAGEAVARDPAERRAQGDRENDQGLGAHQAFLPSSWRTSATSGPSTSTSRSVFRLVSGWARMNSRHGAHVGARADLERDGEDPAAHGRERDRLEAALVGAQESRAERLHQPLFLAPDPCCGPTAWITPLKGSLPAVVTTASSDRQRPVRGDDAVALLHQGFPAARAIAAATPPPCTRCPFAALTIASVVLGEQVGEDDLEGAAPGTPRARSSAHHARPSSLQGTSSSLPVVCRDSSAR